MREYSQNGIAATGVGIGQSGFNVVHSNDTASSSFNTAVWRCGEAYKVWARSGPSTAAEKAFASSVNLTATDLVNTDTKYMYKRFHTTLSASMTVGAASVRMNAAATTNGYDNDTIKKGYYYVIGTEIIGIQNSAIVGTVRTTSGTERGCFGTTAATHSADDNVYEMCFAIPDLEYWGFIQAHSDHIGIGYIEEDDELLYDVLGVSDGDSNSGDDNLGTWDNPDVEMLNLGILKGDGLSGRFTSVGLGYANGERPELGGGILLYKK
mgnify:CR=1 FL=1